MDINQAFSGAYLKAADLQGREVPLVISHVTPEEVGGEPKLVMYFINKDRGFVLNKTNATTIAEQHGNETDHWVNKPITLFPSQTDYQGKQVACIRVKLSTTASQLGAATPPVTQAPVPTTGPDALDDSIPF